MLIIFLIFNAFLTNSTLKKNLIILTNSHNVPAGIYILNVNDPLYEYEQIFLEVTNKDTKAFNFNSKLGKKGNRIVEEFFEINSISKIKYEEVLDRYLKIF